MKSRQCVALSGVDAILKRLGRAGPVTEEAGMTIWARAASGATAALMLATWVFAQAAPSASGGWVATPAAGATSTDAYVTIENPTMYEVFVIKVTSDAAGAAEIAEGPGDAAKTIRELPVPAYGSAELKPGALRIRLKDLNRPLKDGDSVGLILMTDGGVAIKVGAIVK
jgi:copper(I)-binding protein